MIDPPPFVRLLEAIKQTGLAVDFEDAAGVAGVKVRHRRNRNSHMGDMPCIAIEMIEDRVADEDAINLTAWEKLRHLFVRLTADFELPPEEIDPDPGDPDGEVTEGPDPTGQLAGARMLAAMFQAMKDPDSPIAQLTDYIQGSDWSPDIDSKEDKGRLELITKVVYRVREDDENVLLAAGENA